MRRSQESASAKPAPAAGPGSAASVGFSSWCSASGMPCSQRSCALALLGRRQLAVARHHLGVAARAERAARAGEQHAADVGIGAERRNPLARARASSPSSARCARRAGSASAPRRAPRRDRAAPRSRYRSRARRHLPRTAYHGCLGDVPAALPCCLQERPQSNYVPAPTRRTRSGTAGTARARDQRVAARQLRRPGRRRDRRRHGARQGDRRRVRATRRRGRDPVARRRAPRRGRRGDRGDRARARSASRATSASPTRSPRPSTK